MVVLTKIFSYDIKKWSYKDSKYARRMIVMYHKYHLAHDFDGVIGPL